MRKAWKIFVTILAPLLGGLWLVYWSEAGQGKEQVHPIIASSAGLKISEHLGAGLIVAALVAALFHLREFSEFFRDLAENTLLNYEYLSRLSTDELINLRSLAVSQIVKKHVTNPAYRFSELCDAVELDVLERALPGGGVAGEYRTDFSDTYEVTWIDKAALVSELKLADAVQSAVPAQAMFTRRVNYCSYTVVRPNGTLKKFDMPFGLQITPLGVAAVFETVMTAKLEIRRTDSGSYESVELTKTVHPTTGSLIYKLSKPVQFEYDDDGRASVWYRFTDYQPQEEENFILNTMSKPTHGLTAVVLLQGDTKNRKVKSSILGLGRVVEPQQLEHGVQLAHQGWFLPQQGYVFWW